MVRLTERRPEIAARTSDRAMMEKVLTGVRTRFTQAKACGYLNFYPDEAIVLYFG
jgi:hypothetical protein